MDYIPNIAILFFNSYNNNCLFIQLEIAVIGNSSHSQRIYWQGGYEYGSDAGPLFFIS